MKDIFTRGLRLFTGIIYESVNEYRTFTHIKSVFNDEWYNFIIPKVSPDQLDLTGVNKLIESERANGFSLSYYVPDSLFKLFNIYFNNTKHINTSSDYFICMNNINKYNPIGQLILVDNSTIDTYVAMSQVCFPEWANNEEYARHMYKHQNSNKEKMVSTYLLKDNNKYIGFCGIIGSIKDNLAYFHNTGVLPEFRRKGYFTAIIQHLLNISLKSGITDTYALVENNSGSYHGLTKLGYKVEDKYHLFST